MNTDDLDVARSLSSPDAVLFRQQMLCQAHIKPLTNFVEKLRTSRPTLTFPDFDPFDAGCDADVLFLLEKPGPMSSVPGVGSGFISRDNDDPTAAAIFDFMNRAHLQRKRTVIWNVVCGWNGTRKVTAAELRAGIDDLKDLFALLPKIRSIVLVGKKAQRAASIINSATGRDDLRIHSSAHPSPIVRATQLDVWNSIPSIWAKAGTY